MKAWKTIAVSLVLMLMASLLAGCEEQAEGNNPLKQCVVSRRVENSIQKNKEKKAEKAVESSLPDLNEFTAQTLDGGQLTQDDLADYDLTMVNIWQTTCAPCIDEMPELAEVAKAMPDNVRVMTWCLDGTDEKELTAKILDNAGFESPTIIAGDGDLSTLLQSLMYTPTTVALDSEGNMIGEPLIGSPQDAKAAYTDFINQKLQTIGKDPIG